MPQFFPQLDFRLDGGEWPYLAAKRQAIAAFWAAQKALNPHLFDGIVLVSRTLTADNGICAGLFQPTPYSGFLHYLRSGEADGSARNSFAAAALAGSDNALVLGQMAGHTANGGKIYFAAGTPDMEDVTHDRIDFDRSVRRELAEETGLSPREVSWGAGWWRIDAALSSAFLKIARSPLDGDALAALIRHRLKHTDGELSGIVVVRSSAAIDAERMPPFVQRYVRWWFDEGGAAQG